MKDNKLSLNFRVDMTEFCAVTRRRDIESQIIKDQEKIDAIKSCMIRYLIF